MGAGWFRRIIGHLVQHLRPVAARHSKTGRAALAQASSAGYPFVLSVILVTGICSATDFLSPKVFNNVI